MAKKIIGVMGPGSDPTQKDLEDAYELGKLIARENWVLLTGGRNAGVMDAASKGASEAGGIVIGILPGTDKSGMSDYVDIPIVTGIGSARNNINVLTSDVVVACGIGAGTTSEVMLALKAGKHVILLHYSDEALDFFKTLSKRPLSVAASPAETIEHIKQHLKV